MANDVFEVLAEDHRRVEGILEALESSEASARADLLNDLTLALLPHARAEEQLVYVRIKEDGRGAALEERAEAEHAMAEELLGELVAMSDGGDAFSGTLRRLKEAIEEHVQMEEGEMFPLGRELLGEDEREQLAKDVQLAKRQVEHTFEAPPGRARREEGGAAPA